MRFSSRPRLALALAVTLATTAAFAGRATETLSTSNALIAAALKRIEAQFPQASRVSAEKVAHAAINGILREIDPSGSSYSYSAKDARPATGRVAPAISVRLVEGVPTIVSVWPHSDASYKEFSPGDIVLKVGDATVVGKTLYDMKKLLEGDAGTSVRLTAYRKAARRFIEANVKRENPASEAVQRTVGRSVGYLQVNTLDSRGVELLKARLEELLKTQPIGMVLDLRSTSGGTVDDAVAAAGLFLSERLVVKVQSTDGGASERSSAKTVAATQPLVVICDFGTNGAAEILAGALQDDKRAVVVGERSFGLASAQSAVSLDPENSLQLTTALYASPSGRELSAEGVKPDIAMTPEGPPVDQVVKFRQEFTRFCRGEKAAKGKDAAAPATAATTSAASSASTTSTTAADGDDASEHGEDEDESGPDGKPKIKTSDGILEDYKLVKQFDSHLVRAINIIISANIFFEYGQHQR